MAKRFPQGGQPCPSRRPRLRQTGLCCSQQRVSPGPSTQTWGCGRGPSTTPPESGELRLHSQPTAATERLDLDARGVKGQTPDLHRRPWETDYFHLRGSQMDSWRWPSSGGTGQVCGAGHHLAVLSTAGRSGCHKDGARPSLGGPGSPCHVLRALWTVLRV